ncbi:hypothetical protein ANN_06320, partial [Periplaneta americana]
MPKFSKPLKSKLHAYVSEFGAHVFSTDGTVLLCKEVVELDEAEIDDLEEARVNDLGEAEVDNLEGTKLDDLEKMDLDTRSLLFNNIKILATGIKQRTARYKLKEISLARNVLRERGEEPSSTHSASSRYHRSHLAMIIYALPSCRKHFSDYSITREEYNAYSSALCNFLHSPVTSSLLAPNIFPKNLILKHLNLSSSLKVRVQVSHQRPARERCLTISEIGFECTSCVIARARVWPALARARPGIAP